MSALKNIAFLAGGFLIGTAGVKILSSKEAKKVYAHTTAAVIRAKDCVMTGVTKVREGCGDVLAEAHDINDRRDSDCCCETIEDESDGCADTGECPGNEADEKE